MYLTERPNVEFGAQILFELNHGGFALHKKPKSLQYWPKFVCKPFYTAG